MEKKSGHFESLYLKENSVQIPVLKVNTYLINGEMREWKGDFAEVHSPIFVQESNKPTIVSKKNCFLKAFTNFLNKIGSYPMLTEKEAVEAVEVKYFDSKDLFLFIY